MGKKYIIELESGTHIFVLGPEGIVHIGEPDVVYETVDGMQIGDAVINAKPYTEPDLEQVREEAYLKGLNDGQGVIFASTQNNAFNDGYKKCLKDMEQVRKEAYEQGYKDGKYFGTDGAYRKGLADVWDAARKIGDMPYGDGEKIFGVSGWHIFEKCTASEVIEKLKDYEREQEEIKVGDEIIYCGLRCVVMKLDEKGNIERYFMHDGTTFHNKTGFQNSDVKKTGRHFSEIAAILEKMREGQK